MNNQSKTKKSIPSKSSAGEVKALRAKIEQLEKQLQTELTTSSKSKTSAEFLLSEFNELGQFWRHTDARLESGINLYMTASALIISGLAYLSQQVTDFKAFLFFVILIAFALFMGGLILAERIVGVGFVKTEYIYGLNLIRGYFVDVDPGIKDYLVLPTASNPKSKKVFVPKISKLLLGVIHGWDSLLLGFVAGSITWLLMPQIDIRIVITIGVIVAIVGFTILSITVWVRKKRAG